MKKEKVELVIEEGCVYTSFNGDLIKVKRIDESADLVHLYNISAASSMWIPMKWVKIKLVKLIR